MLRRVMRQYFCDQMTLINTGLNEARKSGTERGPEQERRKEKLSCLMALLAEVSLRWSYILTMNTILSYQPEWFSAPWAQAKVKVKVAQSCLTFCDPHELYSWWNSPGQNTGVSSCFLPQGISPTQGSNPGLLHCRRVQ